jgi:hypothetical protein
MFQLTDIEKAEVVSICDHLAKIKYSATNPYAFTEHGNTGRLIKELLSTRAQNESGRGRKSSAPTWCPK